MNRRISIDNLIEIVRTGGKVKTGIDVYNDKGILLLDKDVIVEKARILEIVKDSGINTIPVDTDMAGGIWDDHGNMIQLDSHGMVEIKEKPAEKARPLEIKKPVRPDSEIRYHDGTGDIEDRLREIEEIKQQAKEKFNLAKGHVKKVLTDIRDTGGEFDYTEVQNNVSELVDFLVLKENPFSFLTQEIFAYDDYLYNHCVNVCTIGTAIIHRFNIHFSSIVDELLKGNASDIYNPFEKENRSKQSSFTCYYEEDLNDISLGFFLHDIGKVLVPDEILNKEGRLTEAEFTEVRRHSYEYGAQIIDKNNIKNSVIRNMIKYHHAPLYTNEPRCYPNEKSHTQIPLYTRVCKLADIYDAMTSKRCYKDAINPINVVTRLFREYAKKDHILQYILHSFVKSIGIYPPGSIVYLRNGQMGYILESDGPIVLPFTDTSGTTLKNRPDPINLGELESESPKNVDNRRSVKMPKEVYDLLPSFIKKITA